MLSDNAMLTFPFRNRSVSCIHPETYQYFFNPNETERVWSRLETHYGEICENHTFHTIEIVTPAFFLRAVETGNPITVIRKRNCTSGDIATLHDLFNFTADLHRTTTQGPHDLAS